MASSQQSSSLQPSSIVKSGSLWKQDTFFVWRKHTFVIFSGEEPCIGLYYQYKGDGRPDKAKPLPGCRVLDILEQQGRFRFTLEFKDKQRWYLASHAGEDRKEWVSAVVAFYNTGARRSGAYDLLAPSGAASSSHRPHHHHQHGLSIGGGGSMNIAFTRSSASSPPGTPGRSASPAHSVRTSVGDDADEAAAPLLPSAVGAGPGAGAEAGVGREAQALSAVGSLRSLRAGGSTAPPSVAGSVLSLPALQQQHQQQEQQHQQHGPPVGHSRRQSVESLAAASSAASGTSRGGSGSARGRAATLPPSMLALSGPGPGPSLQPSPSKLGAAAAAAATRAPPPAQAAAPPPARSSIFKFLLGGDSGRGAAAAAAQQPAPPPPPRYEVAPLGPSLGLLDVLSGKFDGALVTSSLCEQFDRARTYVDKYPGHFSDQQRAALQNWTTLVESRAATPDVLLACKALYVLEVTRARADWATADEGDNTFAGPEAVIVQVRRLPNAASLGALKECLDYCSADWADMYCRLDGAALLLDVMRSHEPPAREGFTEAVEALTAALQCVHSLGSKPGGMAAMLAVAGFTRGLAALLRPVDADTARLALELLTRMLLFSDESYRQVLKAKVTPAKAAPGKPQQQSVIDSKRAYNINILMGSKIKISVDALRSRVVQLDPRVFDNEEAVGALLACVPSADDAAALAAYRDSGKPVEDLGEAERVCLQLMSVPAVEQRLRVYGYKFATPHKLNSAKQVFGANLRAIEAMRCSRMFRRALRLALAAGNFMNHGSRLGNAVGFRLRALPKMQDTNMKSQYEALLRYYGENLNSTPSDTEFWTAISAFVDKFSAAQKALVAERKEKEEREARRRQREAADADKARRASMRRQETQDARERLLSSQRTPSKAGLALGGSNPLAAAAAAMQQAGMQPATPLSPAAARSTPAAGGGGGGDGGRGSEALMMLTPPLAGSGSPRGAPGRAAATPLGHGTWAPGEREGACVPGSPMVPALNGFASRLHEAGFTLAAGQGAGGMAWGSPNANAPAPHPAGPPRPLLPTNLANGLGAAAAASMAAAAAGMASAAAGGGHHHHLQQQQSGGGALPPLAPRPSYGGVGHPPPGAPAGNGTQPGPPAAPAAHNAGEEERALRAAKHASNSALASILMASQRAREGAQGDGGEGGGAGALPLGTVSDGGALTPWGSGGSGGAAPAQPRAASLAGWLPADAGGGMSGGGSGSGGGAALLLRERHEDWSIRIAVEDVMQSMLDDLLYGRLDERGARG
ncbi:Formin-like protein 13 [Tetrabaena socialis]|uniref:Formin-like protein n=1 Tax=Tetrabaena socialis TaxID=47790 RepID=A0A2J8ADG5_9CHLO|nr:Formin-like protein 13 [Tetrabaena socialis]|eukprot:PNH10553.1 Formin-like protein 13 [Tetrabaena socialis]